MRLTGLLSAGIIVLSLASSPASAVQCNMARDYTGPDQTAIWKSSQGPTAFYFQSNSDVNTDGSGRSYHPDDIAANQGLAQNMICNGVSRKLANGQTASCVGRQSCQTCLDLYRSVPKATMVENFGDYFDSFAIATEGKRACVVPAGGTNAGYFVSTTSYVQRGKGVCDPDRYLDAMVFPAIAVPKSLINKGVGMGDLVLVRNRANGRSAFGVVYDSSGGRIGESSIAMNRLLLCRRNRPGCEMLPMPTTLRESYGLVVQSAEFLIFPGSAGTWPASPAAVETVAKQKFENWGGKARLDVCAQRYAAP